MTTATIVGAGFSGSLLAIHLLRRTGPGTTIRLIESSGTFGQGLAYGTTSSHHRLNVRAAGMSAFRDRPSHFVDWMNTAPHRWGEPHTTPESFVPRQDFGTYIRSLLDDERRAHGPDRLELLHGTVTSLTLVDGAPNLILENGRSISTDLVALALGNPPPTSKPLLRSLPCYRPDPWAADVLADLAPDATVLLIGTGLTAMDMVMSLVEKNHRGTIHALSRRGLLPQRHAASPNKVSRRTDFPTSHVDLLHSMRQEARSAAESGQDWRPVVDSIRPFTSDIWQLMHVDHRASFLRHLRPWWDVHRHRLAPEISQRIEKARADGQLVVQAGHICRAVQNNPATEVFYRPRGKIDESPINVDRIVDCSGPGSDYRHSDEPIISSLLHQGLARPDALRLGLDVTANCALRGVDGSVSRVLFAVGPMTKGTFWEMVAVPDIRRQAELLAGHLAGLLLSSGSTGSLGAMGSDMFVI